MEKERVVVNDTNVFIDLYSIGLLEEFFSLPWEVHTTNLVMLELKRQWQNEEVSQYKTRGQLHIPLFSEQEVQIIGEMKINYEAATNVSLADCSVWYYARANNYILLTGDRKLRGISSLDGVEVHGILYVFKQLVAHGILTPHQAVDKLTLLYSINPRLPKAEFESLIRLWRGSL